MIKRRPSIGKVAAAVIAIVIIVIASGAGYYYYLSTIPKPVSMTVLADSGTPTEQYLEMVAKDFEAAHPNVIIQVEGVSYSSIETTAETALKDKAAQPSIIVFYPSQGPGLAPYIANLEQYSKEINLSNMIYAEMEHGGYYFASNGTILKVIGVPIHSVFGYVLGYQKSLFENQTLAVEFKGEYGFDFNPENLTTLTQLYDIASFLNQTHAVKYPLLMIDSPAHSIWDMAIPMIEYYGIKDNVAGITAEPPGEYTLFSNVTGTWTTTFNSTAGVDALMMWRKLIQFQPSLSVQSMGYDQQGEFPQSGLYGMFITWTSFIPAYEVNTSKIAGNLGIALLPDYMTGFAPTLIGINPYGPNPKLAAEFIAFAMSDQEYEKGVESMGYIPGTYTGLKMASQNPNMTWLVPFAKFVLIANVPTPVAASVSNLASLSSTLIPIFNGQIYKFLTASSPTPQLAKQDLQVAATEWMNEIHQENISL